MEFRNHHAERYAAVPYGETFEYPIPETAPREGVTPDVPILSPITATARDVVLEAALDYLER